MDGKFLAENVVKNAHFLRCIGVQDCKHIVMQNPFYAGSTFINYKGTFCVVLIATTYDSNY